MKIALALFLGLISLSAVADQFVNGYVRKDGTYVQPHWRSSPNGTKMDNYSTAGNVNPYTGAQGYNHDSSPNYGQPGYPNGQNPYVPAPNYYGNN